MKIYEDKALIKEIEILDLGIVPAGETKRFTFYVLNDSKAHLRILKFTVAHDEVKVIDAPEELTTQAKGELILEWSPSVTLKQGLKAQLRISGIELWG